MPKAPRTQPRLEPPAATDLRGDKTRNRLLDAGLRLFGRHGPDGVSTRVLALEAGVNLAAIPYHFRSKEGVYLAVAHRVVETVGAEFRHAAERIDVLLQQPRRERAELVRLLIGLMTSMLRTMSLSQERAFIGMFIMREQLQPSEAFNVLYEGFMRPVGATYSKVVAALRNLSANDPRVGIEVQMLVGQVLMFCIGREALLRRLHWKQLDEKRVVEIERVIDDVVSRQFAAAG